jgi:aspartate/methionine/tyrosine aminotransferase
MRWAKTSSEATYNLASSGLTHFPLKDLGVSIEQLEISGPTIYGYQQLIKELAAKCGVEENCVATAIGTSMANHLVLAALLEPGDEVLIEHPTYEPLLAVAKYLRTSIKRFYRKPENGFQLVPEEIAGQITPKTKLIVITNLHNPTGVHTDQETLRWLGQMARDAGARVMVDEVYLECTFPPGGSRYSAFHLGNEFVTTGSLTKAYGLSGLRCGWILAEPDLIRRFHSLNDLFYATPPHSAELLSVVALQKLPSIAARAKQILQTNRNLFAQIVDNVNYFLDLVYPEFGTILFPRLKSGSVDSFLHLLKTRYDTSAVPGSFFEMPDHFRLGLGGPTENVQQGLQNLVKALGESG